MLLRRRLPLMLHERAQELSAVDTEAEAEEAEGEGEPGEVRDTSQWFVSKFISSSSRGAGSFDVSFRSVRTATGGVHELLWYHPLDRARQRPRELYIGIKYRMSDMSTRRPPSIRL